MTTSAAIRLARAFSGRDVVLALGYHGWQDWYVGATVRHEGVPEAVRELTRKIPYNDLEALSAAVTELKGRVAAIILEPMSAVYPQPGYLESVRELANANDIVLVFDEVITGFRFAMGGAQAYFGVVPDLACFGKAMANGMPISAIVGRADIMRKLEDVFYSGTFGGEALSIAASIATIDKLEREDVIAGLWSRGEGMQRRLTTAIDDAGVSGVVKVAGAPPFTVFQFAAEGNVDADEVKTYFIKSMAARGVLINASVNLTHAHREGEIDLILQAVSATCCDMRTEIDAGTLRAGLDCAVVRPVFRLRG